MTWALLLWVVGIPLLALTGRALWIWLEELDRHYDRVEHYEDWT